MTQSPITLYDETTPNWYRSPIQVIETPFEKKRRLEADLQKLWSLQQQAQAKFDARVEAIQDHELRIYDQLQQVNRELEEMGEEV